MLGCLRCSQSALPQSPTYTVQPSKICQDSSDDTLRTETTRASITSLESADATFETSSFVNYHCGVDIERRYKIERNPTGFGGYGKVFKAEDRQCKNRMVAIKKVRVLSETSAAEYMKEARIMQKLDHPGICKLFEVYQDGEDLFLVLEYLEGGELFDKIMSRELTEKSIADVVKQVACALKHAHSCGVAHRDLKPENICFSSRGSTQVKVIDWGLSSICQEMQSRVGTSTYSAPEVFGAERDDEPYTNACDLWSLGVLAYVMLCGRPPFWGGPFSQLKKMRAEEYPMDGEVWEKVSDSAKDFVRCLLKANPLERMPLEDVLSHEFLDNNDEDKVHVTQIQSVLSNMVHFTNTSRFFSLIASSAARQLDHSQSNLIRKVFNELDTNHDGVLDRIEMRAAFEAVFGENSDEVNQIQQMFHKLNLDGTGKITYTEFCSAGMGEDVHMQDEVLWSAFKSIDEDDNGMISGEELEQLLENVSLAKSICKEVVRELMSAYDSNGDGFIDFEEFKGMMQSCAKPQTTPKGSNVLVGNRRRSEQVMIVYL